MHMARLWTSTYGFTWDDCNGHIDGMPRKGPSTANNPSNGPIDPDLLAGKDSFPPHTATRHDTLSPIGYQQRWHSPPPFQESTEKGAAFIQYHGGGYPYINWRLHTRRLSWTIANEIPRKHEATTKSISSPKETTQATPRRIQRQSEKQNGQIIDITVTNPLLVLCRGEEGKTFSREEPKDGGVTTNE